MIAVISPKRMIQGYIRLLLLVPSLNLLKKKKKIVSAVTVSSKQKSIQYLFENRLLYVRSYLFINNWGKCL